MFECDAHEIGEMRNNGKNLRGEEALWKDQSLQGGEKGEECS